jgi:hypothetical protein
VFARADTSPGRDARSQRLNPRATTSAVGSTAAAASRTTLGARDLPGEQDARHAVRARRSRLRSPGCCPLDAGVRRRLAPHKHRADSRALGDLSCWVRCRVPTHPQRFSSMGVRRSRDQRSPRPKRNLSRRTDDVAGADLASPSCRTTRAAPHRGSTPMSPERSPRFARSS